MFDASLFRILIEHSFDAITTITRDGRASYVSPVITRVLGYSPDEFLTFDAFEIVHPDDRKAAADRFTELVATPNSSQTTVNRVRHKDGSWRWIETVASNHLDTPHVDAIIASCRDVTERRQATEAVRQAEEKFRSIVESATEFAIFTTDLNGNVNSWNSGASRLLGYDESEVIGRSCRIFFSPEDNERDKAEAEMHDALVQGRGRDERWHVRKDGSQFWGSGWMMPLRDEAGSVRGYLKIFRDMTRTKLAEEALKEASRRKDDFLAILAHELRNPLAAISNAALLLQMPADDRTSEWAPDMISRQTKYLSRLLDDLLDVSRITRGKLRLKNERLDLSPVIAKAIETVRPLVEEKRHSLAFTVSAGGISVVGDPVRIEQVFVNLLSNAAKYTDEGGSISVIAQKDEMATIVVRDNGIGISADMLTRIFEPFAQAEQSLDRSQGGLGIGLTLARSLIDLHGGTISVKSEGAGRGSEFAIRLPLASSENDPETLPANQTLLPPKRTYRVLVVDDNQDSAVSLATLLKVRGYETNIAYDGPAAIELARSFGPDAILLDIGLPNIDGYEVARQIRNSERGKSMFLIAISGYGQEQDRRRSKEAGFDHHFVKPVDFTSLSSLLSERVPNVPK
ncbi:MAG TPA: PAS domain S-box protein [Pirellulales bacterium]